VQDGARRVVDEVAFLQIPPDRTWTARCGCNSAPPLAAEAGANKEIPRSEAGRTRAAESGGGSSMGDAFKERAMGSRGRHKHVKTEWRHNI